MLSKTVLEGDVIRARLQWRRKLTIQGGKTSVHASCIACSLLCLLRDDMCPRSTAFVVKASMALGTRRACIASAHVCVDLTDCEACVSSARSIQSRILGAVDPNGRRRVLCMLQVICKRKCNASVFVFGGTATQRSEQNRCASCIHSVAAPTREQI